MDRMEHAKSQFERYALYRDALRDVAEGPSSAIANARRAVGMRLSTLPWGNARERAALLLALNDLYVLRIALARQDHYGAIRCLLDTACSDAAPEVPFRLSIDGRSQMNNDAMEYAWQRTILDAYGAPTEFLPDKIKVAERAIADRLNELPPPDAYEKIALRDALNALRVLVDETTPRRTNEKVQNKNIA